MKSSTLRTHEYLYTVRVDGEDKQVKACNMDQAATRLGKKLDEVIYIHKEIIQ